jgi:hypothetical protein
MIIATWYKMMLTPAQKAAQTRKRRASAAKGAATRKRRATAAKAAATRKKNKAR